MMCTAAGADRTTGPVLWGFLKRPGNAVETPPALYTQYCSWSGPNYRSGVVGVSEASRTAAGADRTTGPVLWGFLKRPGNAVETPPALYTQYCSWGGPNYRPGVVGVSEASRSRCGNAACPTQNTRSAWSDTSVIETPVTMAPQTSYPSRS
uniref:Uncharacterized protein n=1 Tax=Branchiostoma floridae TaxID=7739 RepID=C3YX93_BRAFL|eukprot:XP_002599099.1 hypothetical protein BRAFLDRAFT_81763 [Branchiostoma floridae]